MCKKLKEWWKEWCGTVRKRCNPYKPKEDDKWNGTQDTDNSYMNKMGLCEKDSETEPKECIIINETKQEKALKRAHEIRKFEIGLYWERSKYMYVMVGAVFVGWYTVIKDQHIEFNIQILLSLVGMVFSLGWIMINKGSRFWQENWEAHIDYLEDEIEGKLYKTVNSQDYHKDAFSVSKVNFYLSIFVFIVFSIVFLYTMKVEYFKDLNIPQWMQQCILNNLKWIILGFAFWIFIGFISTFCSWAGFGFWWFVRSGSQENNGQPKHAKKYFRQRSVDYNENDT